MAHISIVTESDIVYGDHQSFLLINSTPEEIDSFINVISLEGDHDDYVVYVFRESDGHKDAEWLLTTGQASDKIIINKNAGDYNYVSNVIDYLWSLKKTWWYGYDIHDKLLLKMNPRLIQIPADILLNKYSTTGEQHV